MNKVIGNCEPVFIIAEAGVNHNGDIHLAKKLIDAAKQAGADAIKFQAFKTENVITKKAEKAPYQKKATGDAETQFEMIKKLELSPADFKELAVYAKRKEIVFLASAFDIESVDLLDQLEVPLFKVASGEITNYPLLKHIVQKNKPIILSTGMADLSEIQDAVDYIRSQGNDNIVLLHCITSYPARTDEANLKVIQTFKQKFSLPVGFSDHTLSMVIPVAAVALGATVIEKHFTLDKKMSGPDHQASLEPKELTAMVNGIREVQNALGDGQREITQNEQILKNLARRSLVAKIDIPKGVIITEGCIAEKRPGNGISPKLLPQILGRKAKMDIRQDDVLEWSMFE